MKWLIAVPAPTRVTASFTFPAEVAVRFRIMALRVPSNGHFEMVDSRGAQTMPGTSSDLLDSFSLIENRQQ